MGKIAVIGDDLTGCMDTGVSLDKKGICTKVFFGHDLNKADFDTRAIVLDLETRNALPDYAYKRAENAAALVFEKGYSIRYLKTDSTLRGRIASQIKALLDSGQFEQALFAPALPFGKRTTSDGIHYIDGIPVSDTDIGKDPFSPVRSSFLPDLFDDDLAAAVLKLDDIRSGSVTAAKAMVDMKAKGVNVICADSASDRDLRILAKSLSLLDHRVLACGSAGFFDAILNDLDDQEKICIKMSDIPVLILSGSPAKASREQIRSASQKGIRSIRVNIGDAVDEILLAAAGHLKKRQDLIIDAAGEGKDEIVQAYAGRVDQMEKDASLIKEMLAGIVCGVLKKDVRFYLMIFGGDTARAVLGKLGAEQMLITGQIQPLVPFGMIRASGIKDQTVITKAGGFGSQDIILETIKFLRG